MTGPERAQRYLVYDEIASGGMASVHLGRLVGPLGFGRIVAIKRLHPHLQKEPAFVAMLLDEARIASRIYHPNVVQTLDVLTEREWFLVLEYVHGDSLARLIGRTRQRGELVEPSICASIVVGMLRGLHAAHETRDENGEILGVVHRDVSPQNVLVGVDGVARVLDFGIAKATNRIQTTREGQLKGKLSYMAPEQLQRRPADRRTDVYAASVVLWELLTASRLFTADDEASTVAKILFDDIAPPSSVVPSLDPALDAIVARGLARNADDRFQTAAEMADTLEACCAVAPAARVAAWVEHAWPEAQDRRERIAQIERGEEPRRGGPRASIVEATASAIHAHGPVTQPQASLAETPVSHAPSELVALPSRRARVIWPVALASLLTAGAIASAFTKWTARVAPAAARVTSGEPPADFRAPAEPASDVRAPAEPSPEDGLTASASAPAPPRATTNKAPRPTSTAAAQVKRSTSTCSPAFTLDENGNRVWKRECFK